MDYSKPDLLKLCEQSIDIAIDAGKIILEHYESFDITKNIRQKSDNSPVTSADIASHNIISNALKEFKLPILSEESADINPVNTKLRLEWDNYWLIDPLDGTREFINKTNEFCINIALVKKHRPILGIIYSPYDNLLYYAVQNMGALVKVCGNKSAKLFIYCRFLSSNFLLSILLIITFMPKLYAFLADFKLLSNNIAFCGLILNFLIYACQKSGASLI